MCGNTDSRGCQFLQEENVSLGTEGLRWGGSVSPVGAGFLGAGLMVVVVGILVTVGIVLGILRVGRKKLFGRTASGTSGGGSALVVCLCERRLPAHVNDLSLLNRITLKRCKSDDDCQPRNGYPDL